MKDEVKLKGHWLIERYDKDGKFISKSEFDNLFLNSGINAIWNVICGGTFAAFNATYATIGVGESATAADATQTDLLGSTKTYKAMDSDYPTYGTSQQAVFKATFGTADANYAWNEFVVKNSSSSICLNRKVSAQGTKVSGQTWIVTVTLSLT